MPSPSPLICRYGKAAIEQAARLIATGDCVAVPTETVYGLAANATDSRAVAVIYAAKGRPDFNPLIVHVADMEMARRLAEWSPVALHLAELFWPGPLTLVLPLKADAGLTPAVTAGLPTVALRMPAHPAMVDLIRASGCPLAAPSANRSGAISPTSAAHVAASLGDKVHLIIDGGETAQGLESTIIAPDEHRLRLLRPGPVTSDALASATGLPVLAGNGTHIEAPGQLASHYAPSKPLRLNASTFVTGEYRIGFGPGAHCDENLSESRDLAEAAARLFAALHRADASPALKIAIAPVPMEGIGLAINDRLRRAAA